MSFRKLILSAIAISIGAALNAQNPMVLHSHNDYKRTAPFWEAYSQHVQSIEADVFYKDGALLVGHDAKDLSTDCSLESMYVNPIVYLYRHNGGKMWKDRDDRMQLMVEVKSDPETTLPAVVSLLGNYPDVFGKDAVRVVVTGNLPAKEKFQSYPDYMFFDGDLSADYTPEELSKVALYSCDFSSMASWNGKGNIIPEQLEKVKEAISKAHDLGKPIRFWGAPEATTVYYTFYDLGIDYFNTDKPATASAFFSDFSNKNFSMGKLSQVHEGATGTKKLDKATRNFKGFQNESLQLSKGIDTYTPTYLNDGQEKPIKNVILLIGDGMGLNQIIAGAYANGRNLSILNMKYIGFHFNNAANAFTTDSAAGGSALGTGEEHWNRHISAKSDGTPIPSLCDYFHSLGKSTGSVSMGNVADATPAVFYGHSTERDSVEQITRYLLTSDVDLVCGSGLELFYDRVDGIDMEEGLRKNGYSFIKDAHNIAGTPGKVVCVDDSMGDAATEDNLDFLAEVTRQSIRKMEERSDKGFFIMIEAPKIDYAGHSDCFPASVIEQLAFDLAIGEAMKYADSNGETLIIVTADHETGGLVLLDGDLSEGRVMGIYTTDDHTPAIIPVFAYGPGSQNFHGVQKNIDIPRKIMNLVK